MTIVKANGKKRQRLPHQVRKKKRLATLTYKIIDRHHARVTMRVVKARPMYMWGWLKCTLGTVGATLTGALGGAAIGAGETPIGVGAGAIWLGTSGAMAGAAASC
ncbi:MAG: hypothetical protein QM638_11880 [Nocardioides sp.]|uniref:hypothetical protein n=1 Tax=Nocardioides sp. TaxID=35761 RepID=UPI0039E60093